MGIRSTQSASTEFCTGCCNVRPDLPSTLQRLLHSLDVYFSQIKPHSLVVIAEKNTTFYIPTKKKFTTFFISLLLRLLKRSSKNRIPFLGIFQIGSIVLHDGTRNGER